MKRATQEEREQAYVVHQINQQSSNSLLILIVRIPGSNNALWIVLLTTLLL